MEGIIALIALLLIFSISYSLWGLEEENKMSKKNKGKFLCNKCTFLSNGFDCMKGESEVPFAKSCSSFLHKNSPRGKEERKEQNERVRELNKTAEIVIKEITVPPCHTASFGFNSQEATEDVDSKRQDVILFHTEE